jgi:hypothetical protein
MLYICIYKRIFYDKKGICTHQNLTKSLKIINTHNPINATKKTRLMYHSMLKYVSGFNLPIHWIRTPNSLPPSKAGIGKTLKIAKAREIIPAKASTPFHHKSSRIVSTILTAPTGPLNLLTAPLIFA